MSSPRWSRGAILALALAASACATVQIEDPLAALAIAESHLERGEAAEALALLEAVDPEAFTGTDLERYKLRLATALAGTGELWESFKVLRAMEEAHPFTEFRREIQNLEFAIGKRLIESDWSFLFFASDAEDGRVVLEHFIVRYQNAPDAADALRLLGEKAFAEGDYQLATERFTDLLLRHEDSEWTTLARFRIAMALFAQLVGPRYDLHAMERAERELADFLALDIENPGFIAEARAARATVREWLARKHLIIAGFYRTVGNTRGWWLHVEMATAYDDTASGQRAKAMLDALAASQPAAQPAAEKKGP